MEREGEHHEEECREADPLVTPLTSTIPESSSPARISADESVCIEDIPASGVVSSQATTTDVVGEEAIPSQQAHTGNLLPFEHISSIASFFLSS